MKIRLFDAVLMKQSEGVCCTVRKRQRPLTQKSVVIQIRRLPFIMALGLLMVNAAAFAADVTQNYRIPAQSLNNALMKFAAESNLELIFAADKIRDLKTQSLDGAMTPTQALNHLLQGSGMTYRFVDAHTVTLEQQNDTPTHRPLDETVSKPQSNNRNKGKETLLPDITVAADSIYDVKDPYNEAYVLPSATAGTKTDTPIMETPLNVQVVSKQVMKDQQVITLADSLKNVSGVVVNRQGNTEKDVQNDKAGELGITLRGFESSTFFRNGFRLQSGAKAMANVESVEILKGPAAILYGLVEPGGMVNVVTKQPLTTAYYAFNQQFGSYDNYRTTLDATGPVAGNKDVLYRMNMSYQNSGSWQDFVGNEDLFVAPVLKWAISPRTQVTAEFEYNRQHQGLGSSFDPYLNGKLTRVPLSRNYAGYSPTTNETFFGNINWSHQFNDNWIIKHSFSANQHSFTTKANNTQFDAPADLIALTFPSSQPINGVSVLRGLNNVGFQKNTYSTNLDLTGNFDTFGLKHTILLGGDYYRLNNNSTINQPPNISTIFSVVDVNNPVNPGSLLQSSNWSNGSTDTQTDQYGFYAQDQIELPYALHVTGGLRYQNIHQKTNQTFSNGTLDASGSIDSSNTSITNNAMSADAVTPRVGILWHPQSWVSLYANYAENFGANTGLVWHPSLQFTTVAPTSAEQYEGGIKTEFFDGRLRATLAYFDLTKTNVATSDPLHLTECGGPCSLAIGAIRSRGPELDIQGEILPGWNAIATYANTDIIVTKTNAQNDPIDGLNVGSRMVNVPRNTASFWSTYELLDTDFKGLKFGAGVTVREGQIGFGGSDINNVQAPFIKTPGYATLDLMTAYSRAVGKSKVTVQLNINNLLDKRYYTNINGYWNDPGLQIFGAYASYGAPRTFLGSISVQY